MKTLILELGTNMSKAETKQVCNAIKKEHRILDYVHAKGIETFERSGRVFIVCPFHDDNDPSLVISPKEEGDTFYCFGCKKKGSIIDFFSNYEKISIGQAINILSKGMNISFDLSSLVKELNSNDGEEGEDRLYFMNAMISGHCRDYLRRIGKMGDKKILREEFNSIEEIYVRIDEAKSSRDSDMVKSYYDLICVEDYLIRRAKNIEGKNGK